jgi:hypothetical protein
MISNLMFVAFGTGIFFGLLVSIVCLMAGVGLPWSVAAGLGICICYIIAICDVLGLDLFGERRGNRTGRG